MVPEDRTSAQNRPAHADPAGMIIGTSQALIYCLRKLLKVAQTDGSVLLCGETGTGKELFARALHQQSARAGEAFVAVDCTALPASIVGSVLFGHEEGAFTGATASTIGLIRQAHRGTLFLDEVGDLAPGLQKLFLRVLEDHRVRPLGSNDLIESDFRLVAATNRDLRRAVAQGQFRQDLLCRLQTFSITLPPLRCRAEDIAELAVFHLDRLCRHHGVPAKQLTPECVATLVRYPWPGNVRELINTLEQTLCMAPRETLLFPKHLPQHIRVQVARSALEDRRPAVPRNPAVHVPPELPRLQEFRSGVCDQAEQRYLANLVRCTGRNVAQACRLAGLSRSRFYFLLKKHQIALH